MDIKKLGLAAIVGAASMWILAGLWHKVVVPGFYASSHGAQHEGVAVIAIAYVVLGSLMAYIYPLGYKGGRPVWEGLRFGLLMGLLWVFPHELAMAGAHGKSLVYVLKNAAWHLVEQGAGGVAIGLMYGGARSKAEDAG